MKIMKNITLAMTLMIAASAAIYGQANNQAAVQNPKPEQEVQALRRELVEAHRRRDRAAFERLITEGFTFIHSTGPTETRKEYIDKAVAGVLTAQRAEVETLDEQIQVYDDHTAVWIGRGVLRIKGENTEIRLRSSSVYVKVGGRWQWAFGQSTRLPTRPQAAAIAPGLYDAYAGQYEISAGRNLTITKEGGTLKMHVPNRQVGELIPKSETEFIWFNPDNNVDAQLIFIKDESGRVTHAAFRQDGKEVWRAKKIK